MVYCAILFYQDYRNHAKSNGKSVAFFGAKRLLSHTLFDIQSDENAFFEVVKVSKSESVALDNLDKVVSGEVEIGRASCRERV